MAWTSIAAIFVVVWWLVLFMVLPFGIQRNEAPESGHDTGAPLKPRLFIKAVITTVIAVVITTGLWLLIEQGVLDFRMPA